MMSIFIHLAGVCNNAVFHKKGHAFIDACVNM